jgi:hypothetical protein
MHMLRHVGQQSEFVVMLEGVVVFVARHQEHMGEQTGQLPAQFGADLLKGMARRIDAHAVRDEVDVLLAEIRPPLVDQPVVELEKAARHGGRRGLGVVAVAEIGLVFDLGVGRP